MSHKYNLKTLEKYSIEEPIELTYLCECDGVTAEHEIENNLLAVLLLEDRIFYNEKLYVNCSDTFHYACADAEPIKLEELKDFYRMSRSKYGDVKWLCLKRKQRPLKEIIQWMKDAGEWDEELEKL